MSEKRNIVLITLDSVRADHCSFMGYHRETTPTIDRMARDGLYFKNAVACGVPTPNSMIGVFTGDFSYNDSTCLEAKCWRNELAARKTLAQALSKEGYSTGAFHVNPLISSYFGFDKGFDTFQDYFIKGNKSIIKSLLRKLRLDFLIGIKDVIMRQGAFLCWEGFYNDIINWIEKSREPFFLWVHLMDTHAFYLPPRKFRKWSNLFDMYYCNWKLHRGREYHHNFTEKEKNKIINVYDDAIRYADTFIGVLWNDLKIRDPIFIIHSDHGEGFGEHGFYGHPPMLYEELIHVPLVIYNADVKGKVEDPVSLRGLAPTILDLIGKENVFPSKSFLNRGNDWVISQVFDKEKKKIAVRMKNWKFIVGQKEKDELYYLNNDPYEQNNLIDEYPKLVVEMKNIVKSHIRRGRQRSFCEKPV